MISTKASASHRTSMRFSAGPCRGALLHTTARRGGVNGCDGDDQDKKHRTRGCCLLFGEREPNDTPLIPQILDPGFAGDRVIVKGNLFAITDVDLYGILIEETHTLVVTVDHSPGADFDVQVFNADTGELLQDCGLAVVPEVCVVSLVVPSRDPRGRCGDNLSGWCRLVHTDTRCPISEGAFPGAIRLSL
jgi:hypothetical protein